MNSAEKNHDILKARWQQLQSGVLQQYQAKQLSVLPAIDALTCCLDQFLLELIDYACRTLPEASREKLARSLAILAVGGYGRGEIFPHSDVDLLITFQKTPPAELQPFAAEFVRLCWDAGLKLGHAIRSVPETVSLSREESQVATSLTRTRLLWGNAEIHHSLNTRFINWVNQFRRAFIEACEKSRQKEIQETASAVYSLEPDVKRSPGGLRDLQLIRWVGFARYQQTGFQELVHCQALQSETAAALQQAEEFLSKTRMELHLHSSRCQDVLTRQEQLRLTDQTGLSDLAGQRAVERFMQQYFRNAELVFHTAQRFVELNRPSSFQERLAARVYRHTIDNRYVIAGGRLNVASYNLEATTSSLEEILTAFQMALKHKVRLSTRLIEVIKHKLPLLPETVSPQAARIFMTMLNSSGQLGQTLRDLAECGLLEVLIPQFSHVKGLLQFNLYHAYTVNEHTFRTLEALDTIANSHGETTRILNELKDPALLPLALLLHALGKGYEEDHSLLGAKIADAVGQRLSLAESQISQLQLLIREHLSMSMLAFRRDTSDVQVVSAFSKTVGCPDTLNKLYLLTICDIQAVAPGLWNDWKARLLQDLYERTLLSLRGQYERPHLDQQLQTNRQEAIRLIQKSQSPAEKLQAAIHDLNSMPEQYLLSTSPAGMAQEIQRAQHLHSGEIEILHQYDHNRNTLSLTILTRQTGLSRCFHRLAGVLTALNFSILAADIYTSDRGLICDRFLVMDRYSPQQPDSRRLEIVQERLREAVSRPVSFEKLFQKHRRHQVARQTDPISDQLSQVVIDNETSSQATIIDVFAHDRSGLLFTVAKAIYDLDLSITMARITTHVDQVVDVFYVTDLEGQKIKQEYAVKGIRDRLQRALDEFERYGYHLFVT